jgi:hypothetical protein
MRRGSIRTCNGRGERVKPSYGLVVLRRKGGSWNIREKEQGGLRAGAAICKRLGIEDLGLTR